MCVSECVVCVRVRMCVYADGKVGQWVGGWVGFGGMFVYMYACMHTLTGMHVYMCVRIHVCIYVSMNVYKRLFHHQYTK